MWSLLKKELKIHIASPVAAVTFALFLFLTGFAFTAHMTEPSPQNLPEASMRGMTYFMAVIFVFLTPLLTMRGFAEERKIGTIELLKTSPLSDRAIVFGKYFSVWILYAALLFLTLEYPIFILLSGEPDPGPLTLSYLGLLLMGGAFLAAGIFCSVVTQSQVIAAVFSFVLLLTLWFLGEVGGVLGEKISVSSHLESFSIGVLDLGDISYYLLFTFLFLFLTVRYLRAEKWR
ncbi:MAG: ABC transporter permease [Deltaproteobacteria bacterium]|nr:ABC transporter permease [Deltaproteobacteria bacterium]